MVLVYALNGNNGILNKGVIYQKQLISAPSMGFTAKTWLTRLIVDIRY